MNKIILTGLAVTSLSLASYATDCTWTGASDNNWSNTANWVGGTLPETSVNTGELINQNNNIYFHIKIGNQLEIAHAAIVISNKY